MSPRTSLWINFVVGLCGFAFSGYLSYRELFAAASVQICTPVGVPGTVLGYPPCIYGFFMYLTIVVVSSLGLRGCARRDREESAQHFDAPARTA